MEKISLVLEESKEQSFIYNNQMIKVKPYISGDEEIILINLFLEKYFYPTDKKINLTVYDYLSAKSIFILAVVDMCTNIKVANEERIALLDSNEIIFSGLWGKISNLIVNLEEVYSDLWKILEEIKEQIVIRKSVGNVIDDMASMIKVAIDKIINTELNEETLSKLKETAKEFKDSFDKSLVKDIYEDSIPKKPRNNRKKV